MVCSQLLTKVWGPEYQDDRDYLWAYIRHLRRKLEADPEHPVYILSEPGFGYVLDCPPVAQPQPQGPHRGFPNSSENVL